MVIDIEYYWQRIKSGDEQALNILFENFYSPLCYFSFQITHDHSLSEEIVQDVFLKLWLDRKAIKILTSFKAYLFQSVRNLSINEVKKRNTGKGSVNQTVSDTLWSYLIDHTESQEYIIDHLISGETSSTIEKVINSLPRQCRSVFLLSRMENKSNKEIAHLMNISVNTVRAHIYHALEKISAILKKEQKKS